jgi:hypothetical protein
MAMICGSSLPTCSWNKRKSSLVLARAALVQMKEKPPEESA